MSRSFLGNPTRNYSGEFVPQPSMLCSPIPLDAGGKPLPSRVVQLSLNWSTYLAAAGNPSSLGVNVLLPQKQQDQLGKIGSIYIDNTGSPVPIYIQFPDTGFVIVAPPSSATWYPVHTNSFLFTIWGLGFVAGSVPSTLIFISNRDISPTVDQEINQSQPLYVGSTLIQRTDTLLPGSGPPALGDQATQAVFQGQVAGPTVLVDNVFGSPFSSGFIYLTAIDFWVMTTTATTATGCTLSFGPLGGTAIWIYTKLEKTPVNVQIDLVDVGGFNLRLDGTQRYQLTGTNSGVNWVILTSCSLFFSTNPN